MDTFYVNGKGEEKEKGWEEKRESDIKRKEIREGDEFRKEDRPETPLVQLLLSFDVFLSVCKKGI